MILEQHRAQVGLLVLVLPLLLILLVPIVPFLLPLLPLPLPLLQVSVARLRARVGRPDTTSQETPHYASLQLYFCVLYYHYRAIRGNICKNGMSRSPAAYDHQIAGWSPLQRLVRIQSGH